MTAEFTLAVHALVYLCHKQSIVSSAELSENICTNSARVRKVMSKLHKAGLAEAFQGKGSGYRAPAGAKSFTLDLILAALDEQPISMSWRSGDIDKDCLVSSGMGGIMSDIFDGMNRCCLERLASISIGDIDARIFGKDGQSHAKT